MTGAWVDVAKCESRALRSMFGSFMTGVTVVSTRSHDGQVRAITANSFTSVSLDPAMILVCLAKTSMSVDIFCDAKTFSVSVLGEWQRDVSNAFASRDPSIKETATATLAGSDIPYVAGSLAVILCKRDQMIDAGDHVILLGAVKELQSFDGQPFRFLRGTYVNLGATANAVEQIDAPLVVGAVLDIGGKIVLRRRSGSSDWEIPSIPLNHGEHPSAVLHRLFEGMGVSADVILLYSLYREKDERSAMLVFSAEASADILPRGSAGRYEISLFSAEDKPWELVKGDMQRGLLQRYFQERVSGLFSIYFDTLDGGRVASLKGKSRSWSNSLAPLP